MTALQTNKMRKLLEIFMLSMLLAAQIGSFATIGYLLRQRVTTCIDLKEAPDNAGTTLTQQLLHIHY